MVSGGSQNLGGRDYFQPCLAAGGREIGNVNDLAKGDIVQIGQGRTFIITARKGGNTFTVVDSNHMSNERVMTYDRAVGLGGDSRAFRPLARLHLLLFTERA